MRHLLPVPLVVFVGLVLPGAAAAAKLILDFENPRDLVAIEKGAENVTLALSRDKGVSAMDYDSPENIVLQPAIADVRNPSEARVSGDDTKITIERRNAFNKVLDRKSQDSLMPIWHRAVKMDDHRGIGMWVTGDGSGSLVVLRLPKVRDYVVKLDFKGRKYFEVPNGEVFWAGADWGGPLRCDATASNYDAKWFKLGFGSIPAGRDAKVTIEGIKAMKDLPSALVNPVIHVGRGTLRVEGTVKTDEILQYEGGNSATLYDRNWNRIADLPVQTDRYVMPSGYHRIKVTGDQKGPQPWMFVRFITEGDDPIVVGK